MYFNELWNSGEKQYTNQNFSSALDFFEKAYLLNPSNSVLNYIGCCYIGLEKYYKAIEVFESLIHTTHWEAPWYNIGRAHMKLGNYDDSLKCFNEALKINPNCDDCHFYLGVYYEKKEEYETAIEFYKSAVGLCTNKEDKAMYYTNIGICYENMSDNEISHLYFDRAMEIRKTHKDSYANNSKSSKHPGCSEETYDISKEKNFIMTVIM